MSLLFLTDLWGLAARSRTWGLSGGWASLPRGPSPHYCLLGIVCHYYRNCYVDAGIGWQKSLCQIRQPFEQLFPS